jgi:hypothetical protein
MGVAGKAYIMPPGNVKIETHIHRFLDGEKQTRFHPLSGCDIPEIRINVILVPAK